MYAADGTEHAGQCSGPSPSRSRSVVAREKRICRVCADLPDWRVPTSKPDLDSNTQSAVDELEDYATYVRLLSWFLDDPSPLCPFSVHRMALIGKELGKEVGEWFGPSTAAGALK